MSECFNFNTLDNKNIEQHLIIKKTKQTCEYFK